MNPISNSIPFINDLPLAEIQPDSFNPTVQNPSLYSALGQSLDGLRPAAFGNSASAASPNQALQSPLAALLLAELEQTDPSIPNDFTGVPSAPGSSSGQNDGQYFRINNYGNMPYLDQGNTNGCGTTSLAMVLSYYGIPTTEQDVDQQIRRTNSPIGGTPDDELQYARDQGLDAEGYNNGTWDQVKGFLNQNYPVMASVTGENTPEQKWDAATNQWVADGNLPSGRHQIVITGYEEGSDGKEYVLFHDPNQGATASDPNMEQRISVDDFQKIWGKEDFGVKNYFMVFAPGGSNLPPGNDDGAQGALGALNGASNVVNGLNRIYSPDNFGSFVHGIPQVLGGAVQAVGCGISMLGQYGCEWLKNEVSGVPVLSNIVDPFADVMGGAFAAAADVCNGFGQACNSFGGALDSLFNGNVSGFVSGVGDTVSDVASGAASAVSDAASAVGDAISDVFSGW